MNALGFVLLDHYSMGGHIKFVLQTREQDQVKLGNCQWDPIYFKTVRQRRNLLSPTTSATLARINATELAAILNSSTSQALH